MNLKLVRVLGFKKYIININLYGFMLPQTIILGKLYFPYLCALKKKP